MKIFIFVRFDSTSRFSFRLKCIIVVEWLETLTCTERLRLESLEVPQWELPKLCHVPPSDLLLWRCPDNINPLSGNGLKSGPFDRREWQQFYQPGKIMH
jgi:hypothetical protein